MSCNQDLITSFSASAFAWSHPPSSAARSNPVGDGELEITPDTGRDYWARSYYSPLLVKADAPALLATVSANTEATIEVSFTLHPVEQFDQAGVLVLVDDSTWVKAGIEYCDGAPRLSCVVTNDGFSDWSTQRIDSLQLRLRVHKLLPGSEQGPAVVVEIAQQGDAAGCGGEPPAKMAKLSEQWVFIRIASLRSGDKPWRVGPFAASPIEQKGGKAVFHSVRLGPKLGTSHDSDPGHKDL